MKALESISDAGSIPATSTKLQGVRRPYDCTHRALLISILQLGGGALVSTGLQEGAGGIRQVSTVTAQTITANRDVDYAMAA